MPLADTGLASAQAVERTLATPESNAAEQPNDAQEKTAPAAPDETVSDPEGGATTPTPETEATVPEPEQPRAQAAPLAAPNAYGFSWTVVDAAGSPLGGATVQLQGPAASGWWQTSWGDAYSVADCTSEPCGPNSMDQDPRPGVFSVDRLVNGRSVTMLDSSVTRQRFRIQAENAPAGSAWVTKGLIEIPGSNASPSPNPWGKNSWDFGALKVASTKISCSVGDIYSVSGTGQLELLSVVDTSVGVAQIGAPASGVTSFNGLGIGGPGPLVYAYNRTNSSGNAAAVYQYDPSAESWSKVPNGSFNSSLSGDNTSSFVGGAVDPDGYYWAGGYNSAGTRFQLWRLSKTGEGMQRKGQVVLPSPGGSVNGANGDFAFDNQGNLYLVRGTGTQLGVYLVSKDKLAAGSGTSAINGAAQVFSGKSSFQNVNGIAYDASGKLYVATADGFAYLQRDASGAASAPVGLTLPDGTLKTTDLATCSFPPTVKIQKDLPDGRAFANDQFKLQLKSGNTVLGEATTTGKAEGIQEEKVGPVPVAIGASMSFTEVAGNSSTDLKNYVTSWECLLDGKVLWGDKSLGTSFTMPAEAAGKEILCTIKNSLMDVSKSAIGADGKDLPSGTPVDENGVVGYKLTFDNRAGANPATVNYRDYLADVLDDATFYNPTTKQRTTSPVIELTGSGLTHAWSAADKWLTIGGTVPAKQMSTLTVYVKVKENADATAERQGATSSQGFFLRNKLARGTDPKPPTECVPGLCVEHPINSWTVAKDSLPADTARLHKGGNVHYKVTATKTNAGTTLKGLVLQDDLTHVFKTAGWAPEAAVPGGAQAKGVYLFNSDGRTIDLNGQPNTGGADVLRSVRDVAAPTQVNVAPSGAPADMRWIVTSGAPLDLPKEAVRAEMWFAVQAAESPAGIPAASTWEGQGNTPATGWKFVNYATGMAKSGSGATAKDFAPNACVTGKNVPNTALAPNSAQPVDVNFPEQCRVQHELSQNYFTIRKDAGGAGVQALADDKAWDPDPTGLWNMIGHEFEVRDNDKATGKATSYPSVQLCRTDYDPEKGWRGEWISPANAADKSRWDFSTENSATAQKILDWNNAHPDETDQLPVCGTLYEISDGGQKGRWRSENLNAGDYWLVETKAPNAQTDVTAEKTRPVPGVQRLAQPVPFKIWPEDDGASLGGPAMQGRGQLDVGNGSGKYLDRCNPGQQKPNGEFEPGGTIAERPTACVNPTGYLMLVKDPAPVPLPLTGGQWLPMVLGGGAAVLIVALAGALWWRRRGTNPAASVGRHGA